MKAPTSTSTTATLTRGPAAGGSATISDTRTVPAAAASRTSPSNIDSPPAAVTSNACVAERRDRLVVPSPPTSRNEHTVVSSQNRYREKTSSTRTSPSIAPANVTNSVEFRPMFLSPGFA